MTEPICPSCAGPQLLGHPAGVLTMQHRLHCDLLAGEDATAAADHLRLGSGALTRTATTTERILLASLGHVVEDGLLTHVERVTPSVRLRTWPDLEGSDDAPAA